MGLVPDHCPGTTSILPIPDPSSSRSPIPDPPLGPALPSGRAALPCAAPTSPSGGPTTGNVRVFVRIRPPPSTSSSTRAAVIPHADGRSVELRDGGPQAEQSYFFGFSGVLDQHANQEDVWARLELERLVEGVLDG